MARNVQGVLSREDADQMVFRAWIVPVQAVRNAYLDTLARTVASAVLALLTHLRAAQPSRAAPRQFWVEPPDQHWSETEHTGPSGLVMSGPGATLAPGLL